MARPHTDSPLKNVRSLLRNDQRTGYANVDMGRATRLGAALWVIGAICIAVILPLAPPTDAFGAAGWIPAGVIVASCLLGALRLLTKGAGTKPAELYAMSLMAVSSIAVLEWLAGGVGTPYHLLFLLSAIYTGCAHPPRRVLAYVLALGPVMFASSFYTDVAGAELAETGLLYFLCAGLALLGLVLMAGTRAQRASLQHEGREARDLAARDFLTGLGNRRRLMQELERCFKSDQEHVLALYDLDGFKSYNDSYGHAAGDDLLARLAGCLAEAMEGSGTAYRMGGDEFCVLAPAGAGAAHATIERGAQALSDVGEGFTIGCSHGAVLLPVEAGDPGEALRIADQRMYAQKNRGRSSAGRQSTEVLLQVLSERNPSLGTHLDDVTQLCEAVGRRLGLSHEEITPLLQAASLHDVGKAAIPDSILMKPGPLDVEEWAFMRRHTLIGERILSAAPALAAAARLVRSSHESWDGSGYPDGLSGRDIPLGSRIIFVCDAFDAMTTNRPYRKPLGVEEAVAELRRCAGNQFDTRVVEAFADELAASKAQAV